MTLNADRIINASVSKSFFVDMLVRDVSLEMAIHDLLDNCIDGALRIRGEGSFDGLVVNITCSPDYFEIEDNCGGIDVDIARNYAFRFGRPEEAHTEEFSLVPNSTGRFGVGMKRAVFKLGRHFTVNSVSRSHRFLVDVDVDEWRRDPEWQFEFKALEENTVALSWEDTATTVRVDRLFQGVANQFELDYFITRLSRDISNRHQAHLDRGIVFMLNGRSIVGKSVEFFELSNNLRPGYRADTYNGVAVRQVVGVGPRNPYDAGWYVFCNGRMVIRADQSEVTGWGEPNIERLPRYHNDFAWFRGCVFFDSRDPAALPWNTTKDGVDQDSGLYRSVKSQMVVMMGPVLQFLREVANEQEPQRELRGVLEDARSVSLTSLLQTQSGISRFSRPFTGRRRSVIPELPPEERPTNISFAKPRGLVDKVKQSLGVRTNRAVGEKTFEYYVEMEIEE